MSIILVNGERRETVSVLDRGLHYGDGVFETIKVVRGQAVCLERHLQRLQEGCGRLRIALDAPHEVAAEVNAVARGEDRAVVKILVTRGVSGRGYRIPENAQSNRIVIRYEHPHHPAEYYRDGVHIGLCESRLSENPRLAGIKHLNRLEQILARDEWQDTSIAEGLMMDTRGLIVEGTMSNVFLVGGARLITPDLARCGIVGIMRQRVLEAAQDLRIPIDITEVNKQALANASEVFLTNSIIGIWPVSKLVPLTGGVEGRVDYAIGPVTRELMQALERESRD